MAYHNCIYYIFYPRTQNRIEKGHLSKYLGAGANSDLFSFLFRLLVLFVFVLCPQNSQSDIRGAPFQRFESKCNFRFGSLLYDDNIFHFLSTFLSAMSSINLAKTTCAVSVSLSESIRIFPILMDRQQSWSAFSIASPDLEMYKMLNKFQMYFGKIIPDLPMATPQLPFPYLSPEYLQPVGVTTSISLRKCYGMT